MQWNEWLGVIFGTVSILVLIYRLVCHLENKMKTIITYLGLILAVAAILFAVLPFNGGGIPTTEVKITSPIIDAVIPMEITVEGYSNVELPKDQHLYIVVEYGGMWWPQLGEIILGYSQSSGKYEFNTPARVGKEEDNNKTFNIRAILVDSAVHQYFQSWFQQNTSTENWSGVPIVETKQRGSVLISDSISVTRE